MSILLLLPIILPFSMAIAAILAWGRIRIQRGLALAGAGGQMLSALVLLFVVQTQGILTVQIGGWEAPFGITVVADLFSAIMVSMTGLIGLSVVIYSFASIDTNREHFGYYSMVLILLMGTSGAFLTGDIFNLYVWFEISLISSFVLLALGGERAQLEGAIKYFALNLLESALFLTAVGVLYGLTGSLNMADIAVRIGDVEQQGMVTVLAILFMIAFGIKAAVFPLFFWLPAAYHTPPIPITTLFSGLMTKVGVYALVRVFTLIFVQDTAYTHGILLLIAGATMITGVLGAVAQYDVRRLLSFHIISQIGYLILGLGLFTVSALAGTIYFMVHVIIAKSALFLVSGIAGRIQGTYNLKKLGSLYRGFPLLALLFLLPALSLGGIPPLSGFWAKLALIQAGLAVEQYVIIAVALAVSILTLFSMTKIWALAFWETSPTMSANDVVEATRSIPMNRLLQLMLPVAVLALLTVVIGLAAEPVYTLATQAAEQLMDPAPYIAAVLGEAAP